MDSSSLCETQLFVNNVPPRRLKNIYGSFEKNGLNKLVMKLHQKANYYK